MERCHACGATQLPPIKAKWCLVTPGDVLYRVGELAGRDKVYLQRNDIPTRGTEWVNCRVAHFERHYSNCNVITGGEILHYSTEKPDVD